MEATGYGKQMSGNFIDYIRLDLIIFLKKVCEQKYSPYYTSLFIHFPPPVPFSTAPTHWCLAENSVRRATMTSQHPSSPHLHTDVGLLMT